MSGSWSGSWVEGADESFFPITNLAYGAFVAQSGPSTAQPRLCVRIGDSLLDLGACAADLGHPDAGLLGTPTLNTFMAAGPETWGRVRSAVSEWLSEPELRARVGSHLVPLGDVELVLPFEVADYVDFYSSEHHAKNVGRIFRPQSPSLPAAWRYLPIGYHGRSGTVAVSGTPVRRPAGQHRAPEGGAGPGPVFGPCGELDFEAEVGFVVGVGSRLGDQVPVSRWRRHVFGVVLVNDWSARDIQSFEYVPLGPMLGKSFLTSVGAFVVPIEALEAAFVEPPGRDPLPPPHLDDSGARAGIDISIEVSLGGKVISRPPFKTMYWTAAQQLAHMTSNGGSLRTGDLFASGTVSGEAESEWGSLLELAWRGERPLDIGGGEHRSFLLDGDTLSITASAPGPAGTRIGFGEVCGTVVAR